MNQNRRELKTPLQVVAFEGAREIFNRTFTHYPIVIGRSTQCDVPLPHYDFISRQHIAITTDQGKLALLDLNSSNGFFFQGQKIRRCPLVDGVDIRIGGIRFDFTFVQNISHSSPSPLTSPTPLSTPSGLSLDKALPKAPSVPKEKDIELKLESTPTRQNGSKKNLISLSSLGSSMLDPHPHAGKIKGHQRVLEASVMWTDQIYDTKTFFPGSRVSVGSDEISSLYIPTVRRNLHMAIFDGKQTSCFIPQGTSVEVFRDQQVLSMTELISCQALVRKGGGHVLKLGDEDLAVIEIGPQVRVHFRYVPAPRQLSKSALIESDDQIRRTSLVSGFLHLFLAILASLNVPTVTPPRLENVHERVARLLVAPPPVPPPEPKLKEKPEEKKKAVIQKIREKVVRRIQPPPKPVKIVKSPKIEKINKPVPKIVQSQPVPPKEKPVDVTKVGALAALNALTNKTPISSSQPVVINVNPNAGGASASPSGVAGLLKTPGGKLSGLGMPGVKTKGFGYGTGSGYGVQGIQGTAGTRAVAGAVVGNPTLVQIGPTEGLTRQQVMDTVKRHIGKIQSCYERTLLQTPGLVGRIEYEWEITSSGTVKMAKVRKAEVSGVDALNSCVIGVFKSMRFPVAKNGQPTTPNIGFPFGRM